MDKKEKFIGKGYTIRRTGNNFQIWSGEHSNVSISCDEIKYSSHTIFDLRKNDNYIGYILTHKQKDDLKKWLKEVQ